MDERSARHPLPGEDENGRQSGAGSHSAACPFCSLLSGARTDAAKAGDGGGAGGARDFVAENALAVAFPDGFPISPGHTLIVPRRHVPTWFEATREEQVAILELADRVKARLEADGVGVKGLAEGPHSKRSAAWDAEPGTRLVPDGYNLGLNCGPAAGQTVLHLHLHVIPRYSGDHQDPRGGVRWIFPDKARYWEE